MEQLGPGCSRIRLRGSSDAYFQSQQVLKQIAWPEPLLELRR